MKGASKVRVIGGTLREAEQFIRDLFLPPSEYLPTSGVDSFRGLSEGAVILVGQFESRPDYSEMMERFAGRNIRILAKIRDW